MGLAQALVGGHRHDHNAGGVITHPRAYEMFANAWFLGQRSRIFARLVDASGARSGDRVLDVGCGSGYLSRRIAPVVAPNGSVVGIDPSEPMLDYAKRHAPANCSFEPAGAENLPFDDASFDLVVSSLAFHHIPTAQRAEATREMFRVVRPGGRVFIADVRPPSSPLLKRIISGGIGHAMAHDVSGEIKRLLSEAGFTITGSGELPLLQYLSAERPH